jgi:glycosyltransferase involved in cell wall biosynthesis
MRSVLGQGNLDLEYIVSDDGLTDGSAEIIEHLQSRHGACPNLTAGRRPR